nr:16S rRNA processing protein RimM [Desulfobacterales bacterium]
MREDIFLPIGKIVGTHGVKGRLKVYSYAQSPSSFVPGGIVYIKGRSGDVRGFEILASSPHKRNILLTLRGIATIEAAEPWIGSEILIDRTKLPELEEGEYYWFQIIGLKVYTTEGEYLGLVDSILPTGSNDVYVVRDGEKEVLVPALESVVLDIDLKSGLMNVDLPEGLL